MSRSLVARVLRFALVPSFVFALAQSALAVDYCVAPNTTCGGTKIGTFQNALDLAAFTPESDRVFLGATTYTAPAANGFVFYQPNDAPVEIVGAGQGQTTVTGQVGGNSQALKLFGGAGTSVHDLNIRVQMNSAAGTVGLWTNAAARALTVTADPVQPAGAVGVSLDGGSLDNSLVSLSASASTSAVTVDKHGGTVRDSSIFARNGVSCGYGCTVERTRVTADSSAVSSYGGATTVRNSILMTDGGLGVYADTRTGSDSTVSLDGVSIASWGQGGDGVDAVTATAPGQSLQVSITNSLVRGYFTALRAEAGGAGTAKIAASYSDYAGGANAISGANAVIAEDHVSKVAGDCFGLDGGLPDYTQPLDGSPLIDAGDPATPQGTDLLGNPLVTDGNHDGIARRDIGAVEVTGPLPVGPPNGPADPSAPAAAGEPGAAPEGAPPGPGTGAPADTQAPLVSGFGVTRKLFAVGRGT
ncbi:MAG: hypothetical protein ACJ786_02650, partial [Catenulispora sp.]